VQRSLASAVRVIGEVVEIRDPYTGGHQRRVSQLATRIAQEMKMPSAQVEEIRVAALIHDAGKMAVPIEILSKPGTLSALEFWLIKGHAEAGYRIVSSAEMAGDTAEIIYEHHERCDGSGYPRGLSGDTLLLGAKVLMVADVVEAMTSHRPYRAALGLDTALEEIDGGAGSRYDAVVSRACIGVFREKSFAFSEP
jgi:putative nucleotidyltransferase with HDIG domain